VRVPEPQVRARAVTECATRSAFVHTTLVPLVTVIVRGEYA